MEDASPTDGVVAGTAGKVAGTTTGVVLAGVVLAGVVLAGVVLAGTPGTDAREVGRCRVEDARLIDSDAEAGRKLTC